MEGRYPNGILLAITNCNDPSKEEEFNYWYNHIHIPDVTAPGVFRHAMRFVNTDPKVGEGKYLCAYETEWDDVSAARQAQQKRSAELREQDRGCPHLDLVLAGAFKKRAGEFRAASRPVRGILAVMLDCEDPAREEEFDRWYSDVHIPDILDTGIYQAAYRYESLDPEATGGKHLVFYESDYADPTKAREKLVEARAEWERRGRLFTAPRVAFRITARRIWPAD